jgi:hypothetical protein
MPSDTVTSPDVYTNALFLFTGFAGFGIDPFSSGIAVAGGGVLAILSAAYHTKEESRHLQRLDVTGVMGYLASLLAALLVPASDWWALLVPAVWGGYYLIKWHVQARQFVALFVALIVWVLVAPVGTPAAGAWGLAPLVPFGVAAALKYTAAGTDTWRHALWHVFAALAGATVLLVGSLA